jgi:hypothetical protein
MLLIQLFGSGGSGVKLRSLLLSGDIWFMVKSEAENIHEDRIGGLAMEVHVFALLRDLPSVLRFAAVVCKWGWQHSRSSKSYL